MVSVLAGLVLAVGLSATQPRCRDRVHAAGDAPAAAKPASLSGALVGERRPAVAGPPAMLLRRAQGDPSPMHRGHRRGPRASVASARPRSRRVTAGRTTGFTATAGGAPEITAQPATQTVAVGSRAAFRAAATGAPTPSVQWEVSNDGGDSWRAVAGATSASYSLTAKSAENADEYRAVFTNAAGTATTAAATLTVAEEALNWSGYVATGSKFTSVSGSWTVTAVTCPRASAHSSQWVGIDGYGDATVEQDGTEASCSGGVPTYGAWYEMYGDEAVNEGAAVELPPASYPVAPGDAMTATVSFSGSTWTLAIADATGHWSYGVQIPSPAPAPKRSSAEWIVERPEIGNSLSVLVDFAGASFAGASATDGATSGPISAFAYQPMEMMEYTSSTTRLTAPGALTPSGEGFTDTWYASG